MLKIISIIFTVLLLATRVFAGDGRSSETTDIKEGSSVERSHNDIALPTNQKSGTNIVVRDNESINNESVENDKAKAGFVERYINIANDMAEEHRGGLLFTDKDSFKVSDNSTAESKRIDNSSIFTVGGSEGIPTASFNQYSNGTTVPQFYKELSNTLLNKFDFLSALTPENYREMITPNDSSSPISRYTNTYYGDESGGVNLGLKASNLLLDTIFEELTGNILTLNLAQTNTNSQDIDAMKIQAQPLNWLKLKLTVDLKASNPMRSNKLELEFNPTSNTALILRNKDNSTETQTGIEFRLDF